MTQQTPASSHSTASLPTGLTSTESLFKALLLLGHLAGLVISWLLTKKHAEFVAGIVTPDSLCQIGQNFNCEVVTTSAYSEFLGIPVSSFNFMGFALSTAFLLVDWGLSFTVLRERMKLLTGFYAFQVLVCVVMAVISTLVVKAYCLYCISLYVVNLLLLLGFYKAWKWPGKNPIAQQSWYDNRGAIVAAVLASVVLVTPSYLKKYHFAELEQQQKDVIEAFEKSDLIMSIPNGDGPSWGNRDAKVQLVEFLDFQCPHCKVASHEIKEMLKGLERDVVIVFKNYPLDMGCNPKITSPFHRYACLAARSSLCAFKLNKEKFWDFQAGIFEGQEKLSEPLLKDLVVQMGMDANEHQKCVEDMATYEQVKNDVALGNTLGVEGTPAIFLNGKKFDMSWGLGSLPAVVRHLAKTL